MSDSFLTFEKFTDPALAAAIAGELEAHGIPAKVVDDKPVFDASFANTHYEATALLQVAPADFTRARKVLEDFYQSQLSHLDPDYYLFSFTDEELTNVIQHPDEWSPLDYALAKQLLAQRGKPVTSEQEATIRQQRIHTLAKPEKMHLGWVIIGYCAALTGGILGLILGYVLIAAKKTLPNGQRVYVYTAKERQQGRIILLVTLACFVLWVLTGRTWMTVFFYWTPSLF